MRQRKEITIVGGTVDAKFKCVEMLLRRFSRRLHKTIIGVVPPIPLFFYTDNVGDDGIIFRWLFPNNGEVTNVCLYIDKFTDRNNAVKFKAEVIGIDGGRSIEFETKRNLNIDKLNIPISAGSRLTLTTESPGSISGVWVSFLFEVGVKGTKKEAFLIDSFGDIISNEVVEDMRYVERELE